MNAYHGELLTAATFSRTLLREWGRFAAKRYTPKNIVLQFCGPPAIAMREMVKQVGPERCVLGCDFPFAGERLIPQAAAQIDALDIPDAAKQGILGANFKRMLKLY